MQFTHLHNHTQYSLLDGATDIDKLMKKVAADGMKAVAITDHGNMFGAFQFVAEANKHNIKPIVGCEFYVVEDRHKKQFTKENSDNRYHQLFLAKDQDGYKNLSKLCSLGFIEGLYSKWPRIDKELILKYHKGLIATTCCIGAEVPQTILNKGEEEGEKIFKWWLDLFGEDYYIELQRHNLPEQDKVNAVLLKWAIKYNVKVIASNDSHYLEKNDYDAHDILLCINTKDFKKTPVGDGKGYRFGFPNDQFYFKTQKEMTELFKDVPEAIDNTNEIADKITAPKLKRDILLPNFPLPAGFANNDDYLRHIALVGAKERYKELTSEIEERVNFELHVIKTMGYSGYFLIVSDFIKAGRDMGVLIGPGRGSAAGSVVAYCVGITNIDPIKYQLLFERFLNPERVTMPDIDTDFDDSGRQKVIDYVVNKYGRDKVAQVITFGSMAAKSSIKDVARALELPLPDANALAKLVPTRPGVTLKDAFEESPELKTARKGDDLRGRVLETAERLEGSVRNSGIHAAAIIIAPDDLTDHIPVNTAKDSDLYVTQFEGKYIEDAGMLKMDFLGLRTLTIIKEALSLLEKNRGIKIDIDNIDLDDAKTFQLFQRGETIGIFQFEAQHVPPILRDMKPTDMEDLIALNALNRPGPMQFIPLYIKRKHGREKVEFPHPLLEDLLKPTYGIMVYQEQIMQCAQIVAGYTLGGADLLRRAMGKKDKEKMAKERVKFVKGALELNKIPEQKANEIFDLMESFADYGFNRSHSAAYSVVAFQTAFLKANYPAEFMAAILTNHLSNIEDLTFFMDECKKMGIPVLGPDINESELRFTVNKDGAIRFGLGGIKGVGDAAMTAIIDERNANGKFKNIFDLTRRLSGKTVTRKTIESLVYAGAFDCFEGVHRAQYLTVVNGEQNNIIEKALRMANGNSNAGSNVQSLFGEVHMEPIADPKMPNAEPMPLLEKLQKEKEVTGLYITGHPLDDFKYEIKFFCNSKLSEIENHRNRDITVAGIVTTVAHRFTKTGKPFGLMTVEDFDGTFEMALFSEDYLRFKHFLVSGQMLFIKGKYQARYNSSDVFEFKISSIQLLQDIKEKMTKSVTVNMNLADINEGLVSQLDTLFKKHPGNVQVQLTVVDGAEHYSLSLKTKDIKVSPDNMLLQSIETETGLQFRLN